MRNRYHILIITLLLFLLPATSKAQIKGVVTDSATHEPLMYITVQYEGTGIGTVTNAKGEYSVPNHPEKKFLTFSAIGYRTKKIGITPATHHLNVKLQSEDITLAEVVVKPKKQKYSRKNNPAVELMRKVISHKKGLELSQNDYYQYSKYEKMKMSVSNITPQKMEKGIYKKFAFFKDQIETSPITNELILPVSIKETASKVIYRKDPESQKTIIEGVNSNGIEDFFSTGDMLGAILEEVFADINIYDDDIKLLRGRFVSPISKNAISFYQYYIMDTVKIEKDSCIHLSFVPQNSQDFGFTGHLYIARDSSYAVKKCTMNLPKKTGINFVDNMNISQSFSELPDGKWVLTDDDMTVNLKFLKGIEGLEVERTTKYSDYKFDKIENRLFRLKGKVIKEANMLTKSDEYWAKVRQVPLTKKESNMDVFMNRIEQIPGFKYVIFGAKALIENFVETGSKNNPSKFDIGPVNTIITSNYVNGMRFRLSGMTTAKLNPHWLFSGYGAYGTKDKKWFYSGEAAYSINKRENLLWEYPKHYISFNYTYDVMSPMDKFLDTDKDNMFVGMRWTKVDQMSYMRTAALTYEKETHSGFSMKATARHRIDEPAGILKYWKNNGPVPGEWSDKNELMKRMTTTELGISLRYAPGESYVNTKQRRIPISLDAPIFTLSHTFGLKGILGGDYNFNLTEASIRKRLWFGSWGKLDITARAGAQWNAVPFPLLNLPMANLSYITQHNESFSLINNMEFLNDRYASLALSYDLNGKLFNRIPLVKKLKWREMFRIRGLWGTLTDKNNPYKSSNPDLFLFPARDGRPTSFVMGRRPYVEASVGIYNIFKLLHVEYVRRLTYTDIPGVQKDGFRFMIMMIF